MKPTKCYNVAGYVITEFAQLQYGIDKMNKLLQTEKNEKSVAHYKQVISSFEKAIKEGLNDDYLLSIKEIQGAWTQFPDVIIQTKEGLFFYPAEQILPFDKEDRYQQISSINDVIDKIPSFPKIKKIAEIMDKNDIYRMNCIIESDEGEKRCQIKVSLEKGNYWRIVKVNCVGLDQEDIYFGANNTFKKEIFRRVLERRMDFIFLGYGHLVAKKLPIIVDIYETN